MNFAVEKQPDYGFAASVNYGLEVSLDKTNVYDITPEVVTSSNMRIKEQDLAVSLCALNGIETEEDWDNSPTAQGAQTVYVRATAQLPGVDDSLVKSNWVELKQVQGYFAIPQPDAIWLIGNYLGDWIEPAEANAEQLADWRLFETTIGNKIYSGVFDMPAAPIFRFYSTLNGWSDESVSIGSQEEDNPIAYDLTDGQWQGKVVTGKGSFSFPDFEGGKMTIVVNLNDNTVQIMAGAQVVIETKYIYLVGQPGLWSAPTVANKDDFIALADRTDSGIYTADVEITKEIDWFNFRFAKSLYEGAADDAWGSVDWIGCGEGSDNYEVQMPYSGPADDSQNTWRIMNANVGDVIRFTVNTSVTPVTVTFETVAAE